MNVSLDAGAIHLDSVAAELKLKTNTGQIIVNNIALEQNLQADTEVGEIQIHLKESPKAASVHLKSDVGQVTADLEQMTYQVDKTQEKKAEIGQGGPKLNASTALGQITVDASPAQP